MRNNKDHFLHFSRRERSGIMVLITISILARLIPYFMENSSVEQVEAGKIEELSALKLISDTPSGYHKNSAFENSLETPATELFTFDPNTLDEAGWVKLGLSERAAAGVRKYVSKGGKFYKPEDIKKIYGLKPELAGKLEPYVRIVATPKAKFLPFEKKEFSYQQKSVDINYGDSAAFESLPGIGPTLAKRIVAFREKLGGFYAVEQVAETYGLPDSTFQKIRRILKMTPFEIRKINLNTATKEELQLHPYIRYKIASLIIAYRTQHGKFESVDDLEKIQGIEVGALEKMKRYFVW